MTCKKPLFLVLTGDGINCEHETAAALRLAGGDAQIMHINDLAEAPEKMAAYDGLAVPGGFSFGDELGSGQIMALKMRHKLGGALQAFVTAQKPVIGICNGFQILVKLGLLPFPEKTERLLALAPNSHGSFTDKWVTMTVQKTHSPWLKDMEGRTIAMPMRHGEGRIVLKEDSLLDMLQTNGQTPLIYTEDVNGSAARIAALTDPGGMILGMMPHPEAFVSQHTYRQPGQTGRGDGLIVFENIMKYLKGQETENARRRA